MDEIKKKQLIHYIMLGSGHLCVALGTAGIFLPLLPTTPFLLLAIFFYARSSKKFHDWLMNHKVLGLYIRDFMDGKGVPLRAKVIAISMIWLVIGTSVIFFVPVMIGKVSMLVIALAVTIYLISLPVKKTTGDS